MLGLPDLNQIGLSLGWVDCELITSYLDRLNQMKQYHHSVITPPPRGLHVGEMVNAHCIDVMMKDIRELASARMCLARAQSVTKFIHNHHWVHSLIPKVYKLRDTSTQHHSICNKLHCPKVHSAKETQSKGNGHITGMIRFSLFKIIW